MLENRRYEDYEELGHYILAVLRALESPELGLASDALKAAVDKAVVMWGEDPAMEATVRDLHNLRQVGLEVRVEHPEMADPTGPSSAEEVAYMVRTLLWQLRGRLHEAFLRDVRLHQAFVGRLRRTPLGNVYCPLFSDKENETM